MINAIRQRMPELPAAKRTRYRTDYGLSAYDTFLIVESGWAYFESALRFDPPPNPKVAASLFGKVALREQKVSPNVLDSRPGTELAIVANLRTSGALSSQNAEDVYAEHLRSGQSVEAIVASKGLRQMSDTAELTAVIDAVIAANPEAVADVRAGKEQALKFLTGQVMKETRGQANAAAVTQLLGERLKS
jgi:aspartyl-tRNA(Asn)/glutamyl-tRNA(Gln) amidotransferase subunit B